MYLAFVKPQLFQIATFTCNWLLFCLSGLIFWDNGFGLSRHTLITCASDVSAAEVIKYNYITLSYENLDATFGNALLW